MADVYTATLRPTKAFIRWLLWVQAWFGRRSIITTNQERPSSNSRYHQLFRWIDVTLWDYHIHTETVRALSLIFFYAFPPLSLRNSNINQEYGGRVRNESSASDLDREYVGYPAISDTLFSQILIFFQLTLMYRVKIFFKGIVNSITKTFFFKFNGPNAIIIYM